MDWTRIIDFLGGSAIVVAAVAFVAKSLTTHLLSRDLERMKGDIKTESDGELQAFRGAQEKELAALRTVQEKEMQKLRETQESRMDELRRKHELVIQDLQAQANERIELVRSALQRVERLEGELVKNRDDAYGEIWKLSECVNLFGPTEPVDCAAVSHQLTGWYFTKGRLLTSDCVNVYFMIQELLNFFHARSVAPVRPAGEVLYCSHTTPLKVLIALQTERLAIPFKGGMGNYTESEIYGYVNDFKEKYSSSRADDIPAEDAWLLLHFMMSLFRTRLVIELGWRKAIQSPQLPEKADARLVAGDHGVPVVSSLGAQHTS